MAFRRQNSMFTGRNLLAGALSFLSGWYCRRSLADAAVPGCVEQTALVSGGTREEAKIPGEKNRERAERNQPDSRGALTARGEKYSGLLVTRRLVVPSTDVAAFAEVLNDFADWNVRQNGFSSQTVYVHEVNDVGVPPSGSSVSERSDWAGGRDGVRAGTPSTVASSGSPSSVPLREEQAGDKEIKALEILTVEEWADPLAARTALTATEMRDKLAEARKRGWDLRGEVWMGMARSPSTGAAGPKSAQRA
ncbi:hypothetical protein CSUI_004560 [Cystoisospora suis]|uniref:Uncharacterized protein n=1 Tax=Cystoisospora suis TaxID=483139 RepID=A0A2C6L152_9APIC|nr:hypothetical protein CSUI_004560 [Cystoisospora suis]